MSSTPSTWPEDRPVIDLSRDGQSSEHPEYARHIVRETGPGAGKQMVRSHQRAGKNVGGYFRSKLGGNASDPMAPPTNPLEREWLPSGKQS